MSHDKFQKNTEHDEEEAPEQTGSSSSSSRGAWVNEPVVKAAPSPLEEQSTWRLTTMLVPATLRRLVAAIPLSIRRRLINFFAIVALVAPLALWIAPSTVIWFSILGFALFSIAMLYGLVVFGPEEFF